MTTLRCPNCREVAVEVFFSLSSVPVNSCVLLASRAEARAFPVGDLDLGYCTHCDFVTNFSFDPARVEYSQRYEETQAWSATFNRFHEALAHELIEAYELKGVSIVEIGCGKGEFLSLLCGLGGNTGLGYDPGYRPRGAQDTDLADVTFVNEFYSETSPPLAADFICCKMTLEHIHQPVRFVSMIRAAIPSQQRPVVFFQVPNAWRIFNSGAFEDVYYEHCAYFTATALQSLFEGCGFQVLDVHEVYDGQYLTLTAVPADPGSAQQQRRPMLSLSALREDFTAAFAARQSAWLQRLQNLQDAGGRAVLWGSGSKAVAFLGAVGESAGLAFAVDINPRRQGHYLPGSGVEIVPPEFLCDYLPQLVIVMNPVYQQEIRAKLDELGLSPELVCL